MHTIYVQALERDRKLTISDDSQQRIINAYLESDTTLIASLSAGIILPYQLSKVSVIDTTSKQPLGVTAIESVPLYRATVVGDMQRLLGAQNDWNTDDNHTSLQEINPNLYQYTAPLPAGTYHYKIAFHDGWSDVLPHDNDITLLISNDNTSVTFSYVPRDATTQQPQVYDSINNPTAALPSSAEAPASLVQITLDTPLDVTHTAQISLQDYKAATIIPRNVLSTERFCYSGDDLGTTFTVQATNFRLWAPTAEDIQLLLYESEDGPLSQQIAMQRAEQGTWQTTVTQNLENWYYLYQITVQGLVRTAIDPYARALATNATRALILDLQKTHPEGWEKDDYQKTDHPVDAIIYEVHIRDFSIGISSGINNKGKFLAFTEQGTYSSQHFTTGISSLQDLGVTHVQVLPAFEFASIDETALTQYNWGYDPRNYNVPEGAYATTPHGSAKILEYKRMIQSLHAANLGIVMDVVYNHTFSTGNSDFDKIVPHYYYRTNYAGDYTNGSGCGNEVASERPMVQKFIRDSLKYWMQEYHVDGFRFDLMALLGVDTMQKISQDLHAINPNLLLYGEPWTGNSSALPDNQLLTKGQQKNLGLAVFNDNIRNSIVGSPFVHDARGFATGATDQVETIKRAISGSIHDFTSSPNETINYASSHDNLTLWDKIAVSNAQNSESDRINMDKLAQAIVITSQGIPFLQGGEEFLRTKRGNDNSYNAGDAINQLNWERKSLYKDVFTYYAGLLRLRQHHPAFRMTTASDIDKYLTYLACPINTIAFQLGAHANQDKWKYILVIYNPNPYAILFCLPEGNWIVVGTQNQINEQGIQQISGTITVTGISCMIFYQE